MARWVSFQHFYSRWIEFYTFAPPLLQASLDQPTQTVVMHRTEPTCLQNMALQLAEKLGSLVENNERVFDLKQGVYGGYFNRGKEQIRFFFFSLRQHAVSFRRSRRSLNDSYYLFGS